MLYFFDNQEKLLGYIDNESSLSVIQTEPLRGVIVLEASVIDGYSELLEASTYVGHVDAVNDDSFQLYRIKSISLGDGNVGAKISAQHVVFDELSSRDIIRKVSFNGLNMSAAFMEILKESRWKLGECNVNKSVNLSAENTNVSNLITTLINKYSIELRYRLKFANNKIIGRFIDVFENRGRNTHKRYAYGHNALSVVKEVDSNNLYTAIIPHGKEIEQSEEERKAKKEKQKLDITKVAWSKLNGNYVDKKIGEDTLELKELSQIYGFSDGSPRTMFKNYDIDDENELIKTAYEDLVNLARPKVQFSAKIEDLGELDIGDSIVIIRSDLGIYYRTRVIEIKRNLIEYGLSELVLGDNLDLKNPQKSTNRLSKQISDLETQINNINVETNKVKDSLKDTSFLDDLRKQLKDGMYDHDSYNYFLKKGNEYGLPPGFYAFNKPIDQNPTSGIWMNGGKMAIANKRNADGTLNWSTWLNGEGIIADYITAGILQGGKVRWNLEDGTFLIGNSISDYSFYWDGSTLHMKDVDIDLTNNSVVKNMNQNIDKNNEDIKKANDAITQTQTSVQVLKDSISSKVSKTEILSDNELREALKGRDGTDGANGSNFTWNLLKKSNVVVENDKYNISNYDLYDLSGDFVVGEDYTLTIWGKLGEDRTRFDFYNSETYVRLEGATEIRQGVYSVSFKWKDTREYNGVVHKGDNSKLLVYAYPSSGKSTSRIDKIKLEKGTNANPVWSPHVSEINGKDGVDGKDGTFEGEIGARNLIKNSDDLSNCFYKFDGGNHRITDEEITEFGFSGKRIYSEAGNQTDGTKEIMLLDSENLIDGKVYTFSMYIKNNRDVPMKLNIRAIEHDFIELKANEVKRLVVTGKKIEDTYANGKFRTFFNANARDYYIDCTISRPQLEEGDVATSWSKNPSDVENNLNIVQQEQSEIKQTVNDISSKITKTQNDLKQYSNLSQKVDSMSSTVAQIEPLKLSHAKLEQKVNSFSSNLVEISNNTKKISTLTQTVNGLSSTVSSLSDGLDSKIGSIIDQKKSSIVLGIGNITGLQKSLNDLQSSITLNKNNIVAKADKIDLQGKVSFSDLNNKGYDKGYSTFIDGGKIMTDTIKARQIAVGSIQSAHLMVNDAMINKLVTNTILTQKIVGSQANINVIKSTDISASRVTTGLLKSKDGSSWIDLKNGNFSFYHNSLFVDENQMDYSSGTKRTRLHTTGTFRVSYGDNPSVELNSGGITLFKDKAGQDSKGTNKIQSNSNGNVQIGTVAGDGSTNTNVEIGSKNGYIMHIYGSLYVGRNLMVKQAIRYGTSCEKGTSF